MIAPTEKGYDEDCDRDCEDIDSTPIDTCETQAREAELSVYSHPYRRLKKLVTVRIQYYGPGEPFSRSLALPNPGWGWLDPRAEYIVKRRGHWIATERSWFLLDEEGP